MESRLLTVAKSNRFPSASCNQQGWNGWRSGEFMAMSVWKNEPNEPKCQQIWRRILLL